MTVLKAVNDEQGNPLLTPEQARIAELEAQVARLKAASRGKLTLKVSEKGAVMVLGLQRFPVTLYREQWERVIEAAPQIKAFIEANADLLSTKE